MRLRSLLLSLAALAASCAIDTTQFRCQTVGSATECPSGQVCGDDLLCRNATVSCPGTLQRCASTGACTDLTTTLNCGGCDTRCLPDQQCVKSGNTFQCSKYCGADAPTSCPVAGGFACKNLTTDNNNCGNPANGAGCGHVCPSGTTCKPDPTLPGVGQCQIVCLAAQPDLCGSACTDLHTDNNNCGTCGNKCPPGKTCGAGICSTVCPTGLTQCTTGKCTDTNADSSNCGTCGNKCPSGLVCSNGQCSLTCPTGTTICGSTCVNTSTDPNNCGGCTTSAQSFACASGFTCRPDGPNNSGVCEISCPAGEIACSGKCVNLSNDTSNCGACGTVCPSGQVCQSNACVLTCAQGQVACNGKCVDTQTDRGNCGACNVACASGKVCSAGACTTSCPAGETNCGGSCVNTNLDRQNCGGCSIACASGFVCNGTGTCSATCPSGSANCSNVCVDPTHDNANCGGCSAACAAGTYCQPVVVAGVTSGQCVASCGTALTACGASCKDTQNDPNNCGGCGTICPSGQSCVSGACKVVCAAGLTPCPQSNGTTACKDLQNDPNNCGVCGGTGGQACGAGKVCSGGTCQLTCSAGLTACGASCVDTAHDPAHCGSCANACGTYPNAAAFCGSGGNCALACNAGFADCNGVLGDGCEVTLATDKNNCGRCGNACPPEDNADPACSANVCRVSCKAGFLNCDGNPANGCESSSNSDAANCGACGTSCASANSGTTPFCVGTGVTAGCVGSPSGVQQNVSTADLTANLGWGPPCYVGSYASTDSLATIQSNCQTSTRPNVLVGCRVAGSPTLLVAAESVASDVFGASTPHPGNSVSWYFDGAATVGSMGFAPQGATITRTPCDTAGGAADAFAAGFGAQRMCWPTASGSLAAGGRCGDREGLGPATTYERVIFTK